MRILALGINYWPEKTGIAVYNVRRSEFLASRGHEVTVATAPPYYPEWRIYEGYQGLTWKRERRNGVDILRSPLFVPKRVTSATRILHEASFLASACLRAFGAGKPDMLFVVSPPLGLGLVARTLTRWWRIPYAFHVEDLQPDTAVGLGMLRESSLVRALYRMEHASYRGAAIVSTLNEAMATRIVAKGVEAEKVRVFPHGVDPSLRAIGTDRAPGAAFRRAHGLDGKFLVVHAGNMGVKQGLDVVLDCAALSLGDRDLAFVFVGDGAMRPALEERVRREQLTNVRFLPVLADAEFHRMLAATDVGLVVQQKVVSDILFPSKLETLLAAGRPVVCSVSATSEVARVVREAKAGLVAAAEDAGALLDAISALRRDESMRARMAESGRQFACDRWDSRVVLSRFEEELARWSVALGSVPADVRARDAEEDAAKASKLA